jgi:Flp pilus assembly protein TadD
MSRLRFAVILLTLVVWSSNGFSQQRDSPRPSTFSLEINGMVRLVQGGAPADKVMVRLVSYEVGGPLQEVFTDRTGKFRFSGLSPAQYVVTVSAPGYKSVEQHVDLQTASSNYVMFQLAPDNSARGSSSGSPGVTDATAPAAARKEYEKANEEMQKPNQAGLNEAIGHLEKAVSIYPKFLAAQLELGTAYVDAREFDKAETALKKATEIDKKKPNAYFALGRLYELQKKYPEAEKTLQEGLKLDEKSWQGHFNLGHVYWDMGNWAKAGPHVGRALQLKPDLAEGHLLAGNILLKARQPENALTEFNEYLRLAPQGEYAEQARALSQKIKAALNAKK